MTRTATIVVTSAFTALLAAAPAAAQVAPNAAPHPSMPWSPLRHSQGQVLRYIQVPPQQVVLEVQAPTAAAPPAEGAEPPADTAAAPPAPTPQRQVVEIPGYAVAVTSFGYLVPERWTIEQVGPGLYRWRKLPAELRAQFP
jgi:hypothetical protein